MHILFIPSWYPSRPSDMTGSFFREQALALHSHGIRIGVITPALRSLTNIHAVINGGYGLLNENDDGLKTVRYRGVRLFSWNHTLNVQFWEYTGLRAFDEYQRRNGRPDVLHVHSMIFGLTWAAAINRKYGIPYIVTEHSSEFALHAIRKPLLAYLRKQATNASRAFAVSSSLARVLDSQVTRPAGKRWEVMPNMVSSRFGELRDKPSLSDNPEAPLILLSVASLVSNKGHKNLLYAIRLALNTGENFLLRICGCGPQESALKMLRSELQLENRVEFLGYCSREEVAKEMAKATALVVASSYETFGVVVIEALMSGTPVVSTRCGGPEDIIVDGLDGILVEKDDPVSLATGLSRISRMTNCLKPANLRKRCLDRFSESVFAKQYRSIYEEVANKKTDKTR